MTVPFTTGEFRRIPARAEIRRRGPMAQAADILRHNPGTAGLVLAVILSLAVTVAWLLQPEVEPDAGTPGPVTLAPPVWTVVPDPVSAFRLDLSGLADKPRLEARVHAEGGGREDIFFTGAPGAPGGFLRLVAYRPGAEARPSPSFFLSLARRAAEAGFAVPRSGSGSPLPTRLGMAEVAEVTLSADGRDHACLAWRHEPEGSDLRLSGWICAGPTRTVSRSLLACILDRFELQPGAGDKALRTLFDNAPKGPTPGCPALRPAPPAQRRSA